jgi:hypothetical protein
VFSGWFHEAGVPRQSAKEAENARLVREAGDPRPSFQNKTVYSFGCFPVGFTRRGPPLPLVRAPFVTLLCLGGGAPLEVYGRPLSEFPVTRIGASAFIDVHWICTCVCFGGGAPPPLRLGWIAPYLVLAGVPRYVVARPPVPDL